MSLSFSIHASRVSSISGSALQDEVRSHTECDEEAAGIVRSIVRLSPDGSIRRFEMTPTRERSYAPKSRLSWSVRAIRW
jgi:hypothetical protein